MFTLRKQKIIALKAKTCIIYSKIGLCLLKKTLNTENSKINVQIINNKTKNTKKIMTLRHDVYLK